MLLIIIYIYNHRYYSRIAVKEYFLFRIESFHLILKLKYFKDNYLTV